MTNTLPADTFETLFDDGVSVKIVAQTIHWGYNYSRTYLKLSLFGRQICTSTQQFKGSPEAWVRARLKARLNYVNRKINELRKFEAEQAELTQAYDRYRK